MKMYRQVWYWTPALSALGTMEEIKLNFEASLCLMNKFWYNLGCVIKTAREK